MTAGTGPAGRAVTQVAVGVLVRADGAVLLADRPAGKPYAGYWEFPGGKIEAGETVEQALIRELGEELGVRVRHADPWTVIEHDYPHAYVRLHFWRIEDWSGTAHPVEGQRLRFLQPGAEPPRPLLPAAVPALRWIQLPTSLMASPQTARNADDALGWLEEMFGRGLRAVLWHEPHLASQSLADALDRCQALARAYGARLFIDSRLSLPDAGSGTQGACHLDPDALARSRSRPDCDWLSAAVRDREQLEHAAVLGCDCAIFDPHNAPGAATAEPGAAIAQLCREAPIPVYVRLEPSAQALQWARRHGAHGLLSAASIN